MRREASVIGVAYEEHLVLLEPVQKVWLINIAFLAWMNRH